MAVALEDKFDEVRQLIVIGKEKGYLLYDEVNDLLPADLTANPEDLEELLAVFASAGIDLVDSEKGYKLEREGIDARRHRPVVVAQPGRNGGRPDGVAADQRRGSVARQAPGAAVEVKGTLRVRSPLTAEFSQKPCAYFKAEIVREEVYYESVFAGPAGTQDAHHHRLHEHGVRLLPDRGRERQGGHRFRRRDRRGDRDSQ